MKTEGESSNANGMTTYTPRFKVGFTTGTAAAAAAKGAVILYLTGRAPSHVQVRLLTGDSIIIPVHTCTIEGNKAVCSIIKDAGDHTDMTHHAEIGAKVMILEDERVEVSISGGKGVGRVTKPGLDIPPGEPAINPGPRKMITQAVKEVLEQYHKTGMACVEIFAPDGIRLAQKTMNPRLGIMGGISILGTTGVVKPMSHQSNITIIESLLSVARAMGHTHVVLITGRRSERFAQEILRYILPEAFIQTGDYLPAAIESASRKGFKIITLALLFGKAIQIAQGIPSPSIETSALSLEWLSDWALTLTGNQHLSKQIDSVSTMREALDLISSSYPAIVSDVCRQMITAARSIIVPDVDVTVRGMIFDYEGRVIAQMV